MYHYYHIYSSIGAADLNKAGTAGHGHRPRKEFGGVILIVVPKECAAWPGFGWDPRPGHLLDWRNVLLGSANAWTVLGKSNLDRIRPAEVETNSPRHEGRPRVNCSTSGSNFVMGDGRASHGWMRFLLRIGVQRKWTYLEFLFQPRKLR